MNFDRLQPTVERDQSVHQTKTITMRQSALVTATDCLGGLILTTPLLTLLPDQRAEGTTADLRVLRCMRVLFR